MTPHELEREAQEILDQADGQMVTMVGLPVGTGQLPDQSRFIPAICSSCKKDVQSTVVKQRVLSIAKSTNVPAQLLCASCLVIYIKDNGAYDS